MRRLLAPCSLSLSLSLLTPAVAGAREEEPQLHEVVVDVDLKVESRANGALINASYTFTPGAINRTDEVVPILRRFVRHPSSLFIGVARTGSTIEEISSARAGGTLQLAGGRIYASADGGIDYYVTSNDPNEHGYWAVPINVEVGFRPLNLLSVGGFYGRRTIVDTSRFADRTLPESLRDGQEQRFGLTAAMATPNDRIYATVSGWLSRNDWSFEEFHPGDIKVRGFGASFRASYQLSFGTSIVLRGLVRKENWVNTREGDENPAFVGAHLDRDVVFAYGGADLIYWYKGRFAFRFGFGGGYEGAPPTFASRETGIFQLGLGLVSRF